MPSIRNESVNGDWVNTPYCFPPSASFPKENSDDSAKLAVNITKSLKRIQDKSKFQHRFYQKTTDYLVAMVVKKKRNYCLKTTYKSINDAENANEKIGLVDALTNLNEWIGINNYQVISKMLDEARANRITLKSVLESLVFDLPSFFDLFNSAIFFDYHSILPLEEKDVLDYPILQELLQVEESKEENSPYIFSDFIHKSIKIVKCLDWVISKEKNDTSPWWVFYGELKKAYLQDFFRGACIEVLHWMIFSDDRELIKQYNELSQETLDESKIASKQNCFTVKMWIPENCVNAYVMRKDEINQVLIPPFTVFNVNKFSTHTIKMIVWKDSKAYLNCNLNWKKKQTLFKI
jgi:hypothetical protein